MDSINLTSESREVSRKGLSKTFSVFQLLFLEKESQSETKEFEIILFFQEIQNETRESL
jgi:hypothetical protein